MQTEWEYKQIPICESYAKISIGVKVIIVFMLVCAACILAFYSLEECFLFNALWRLSPIGINLQGPICADSNMKFGSKKVDLKRAHKKSKLDIRQTVDFL